MTGAAVILEVGQGRSLPADALSSCLAGADQGEVLLLHHGPDAHGPLDERVRPIPVKGLSRPAALREAVLACRADYVKVLGPEDRLLPHCLRLQVASLAGGSGRVSAIGWRVADPCAPHQNRTAYPVFRDLVTSSCYLDQPPLSTFLIHRGDLLPALEAWTSGYDADLLLNLALNGVSSVALNVPGLDRLAPEGEAEPDAGWKRHALFLRSNLARLLASNLSPGTLAALFGAVAQTGLGADQRLLTDDLPQVVNKIASLADKMDISEVEALDDYAECLFLALEGEGTQLFPAVAEALALAWETRRARKFHGPRFAALGDALESFRVRLMRVRRISGLMENLHERVIKSGVDTLAVWGAGTAGNAFMAKIQESGPHVAAIIDGNENLWGKKFWGITIVSPDEAKTLGLRSIAICSPEWANEIESAIRAWDMNDSTATSVFRPL